MVHLRRENAEISTYAMWIVKFDPCTSKRVAMEFGKSCIIWRLSCIMVLYTSFWPVTLAEVNSAAGVISQSVTTGTQDVDNRLLIFGAGYDNRTNEGSTSQLPEQTMPSEPSAPTAHDELMTSTIPTVPWIAVSTQSQTHTTHSQQETTQIPGEFNFLFFDNDLSRGLPAPVANRTALYLMGLVTVEIGSAGWSSAGVVPALQMAMRDVNARQDLLPGYELRLHMKDTKCDEGYAIQALYEHLTSEPARLLIVGGGCSLSTAPVARAAPHFGLVQVAYSAASPELSDRDVFPTFFRTTASDYAMVPPVLHLCRRYLWLHIATLYEINDLFAMTMNLLHRDMQQYNISLITANSFSSSVKEPIQDLQTKKARIIVSDSYEGPQRRVFCEVYHQGMYGAQYQWIVPGWYSENWLQVDDTPCSLEELHQAAEYAITITDVKQDVSGQRSISGQVYDSYQRRYEEWPSLADYGYNQYHPLAYDAVWAAALALNATQGTLNTQIKGTYSDGDRPRRLEKFIYEDGYGLKDLLLYHLERTEFQGVSGLVSFQDGDRVTAAEIGQIRGGHKHVVAIYYPKEDRLDFLPGEQLLWHGAEPPVSRAVTVLVTITLSPASRGGLLAAASLGTLAAIAFLVFNCRYHSHPFIKMSSPRLNNVILLGCGLAYVHAISLALDITLVTFANFHFVCMLREWTLPLGFSSLFGAMFVKTWRVHRIFTRKVWLYKPAVQDRHLMGFLGVLLALDTGLLTAWTIVDGVTAHHRNTSQPVERESVVVQEQAIVCHSAQGMYWIGALYGTKVLLLLVGCFLAYETRRITVPALNDSRHIGLSVYNVVVMSVLGVAVTLGLADDVCLALVVRALCTILTASTTMLLVFLPKVRYVYKHPPDSLPTQKQSQSSATFTYTLRAVSKSISRSRASTIDSNPATDISMAQEPAPSPVTGVWRDHASLEVNGLAMLAAGSAATGIWTTNASSCRDDIELTKAVRSAPYPELTEAGNGGAQTNTTSSEVTNDEDSTEDTMTLHVDSPYGTKPIKKQDLNKKPSANGHLCSADITNPSAGDMSSEVADFARSLGFAKVTGSADDLCLTEVSGFSEDFNSSQAIEMDVVKSLT